MSWQGEYFGPDGALAQAQLQARLLRKVGAYRNAAMTLVSPYYSAAGAITAAVLNGKLSRVAMFRAWYYGLVALRAACYVYKQRSKHYPSPSEWSVLLPVLSGIFGPLNTPDKVRQIVDAEISRSDCAPHDAALMLAVVMKMWIKRRELNLANMYAQGIEGTLTKHPKIPVGQRARLWRDLLQFYLANNSEKYTKIALGNAWQLTSDPKLADQSENLRAFMLRHGVS